MVRSLYSAASGMMAQQTNVDVIANNLANVNTIGYKSQSAEFKSLLYQDLQAKTTSANGENKPVSAQVGLGSRISSITSHYTQGSANATDGTTDFLINGMGFFAIENIDGNVYYTRNGNFFLSERFFVLQKVIRFLVQRDSLLFLTHSISQLRLQLMETVIYVILTNLTMRSLLE